MSVAKLPTADTNFKQKQDNLGIIAGNVYTQMLANVVTFPDPPIPLATYVTTVNNYNTLLASAVKGQGSKSDTQAKNLAKKELENSMRVLAQYVTNVAYNLYNTESSTQQVANMRVTILSSGFKIAKTSAPAGNSGGLDLPKIVKLLSPSVGVIQVLLRQYVQGKRGKKWYTINYRTSAIPAQGTTPAVPAGDIESATLTSGNIMFQGIDDYLISGTMYDVQFAAIGGHNTKLNTQNPQNFTPWRQIIVT